MTTSSTDSGSWSSPLVVHLQDSEAQCKVRASCYTEERIDQIPRANPQTWVPMMSASRFGLAQVRLAYNATADSENFSHLWFQRRSSDPLGTGCTS